MSAPSAPEVARSTGLIEKDTNGDVLWTWSYPSVSSEDREFYTHKSQLSLAAEGSVPVPFLFSQWRGDWYYIYSSPVENDDILNKVTHFSIVIVAKDFNPEKYESFGKVLANNYLRSGSPVTMLESYLSVFTRGTCGANQNGKFAAKNFNVNQAYLNSKLRAVVEIFGLESIILYTALMLKKKIVVYYPHARMDEMLQFVRSLPALVWHRKNWGITYPYVGMNDAELNILKGLNTYVAGFTDASIEGRSDLYDVFVSPTTGQISIAAHAKDSLALGKLHKDTAMLMVQCAENNDMKESDIIQEIAKKTSDLLNNLNSLAVEGDDGRPHITLEVLRSRKMTPATENFLYTLAACEGLVAY